MDGALVLYDVVHKRKPYNINAPILQKWGVGVDAVAKEGRAAVEKWRALPASEA